MMFQRKLSLNTPRFLSAAYVVAVVSLLAATSLPGLAQPKAAHSLPSPRVQLLDFWATTCGPCRPALAVLQSLHARFPALTLHGYALDDPDTAVQIGPVLHGAGVTFPVTSGPAAQRLAARYGVQTYPTLFLLKQNALGLGNFYSRAALSGGV